MTSGTRDPTKYIRRGEEGERASDLGPSENQATSPLVSLRSVGKSQSGPRETSGTQGTEGHELG